ncbi:MAG: DNA translocase FtsK [Bacilli bacterium]
MLSNGKKKTGVSVKQIRIVSGIIICLFSIFVILNYGYVATGLLFPAYYLFGNLYFLPYSFLFLLGIFLIFKNALPKGKKWNYIVSAFFVIIGILMMITLYKDNEVTGKDLTIFNFIESLNSVIHYNDGYPLKLMNLELGGGFIGMFLTGSFNTLCTSWIGTFSISIIFMTIGVLFVLFSPIKCLILVLKANHAKSKPLIAKEIKSELIEEAHSKDDQISTIINEEKLINEEKNEVNEFVETQNSSKDINVETATVIPESAIDEIEKTANTLENTETTNKSYYSDFFTEEKEETNNGVNNDELIAKMFGLDVEEKKENATIDVINIKTEEIKEEEEVIFDDEKENIIEDFNISNENREETNIDVKEEIFVEEETYFALNNEKNDKEVEEKAPNETNNLEEKNLEEENLEEGIEFNHYNLTNDYIPPSIDLFEDRISYSKDKANVDAAEKTVVIINNKLKSLNAGATIKQYVIGPAVTRYSIFPDEDVSVSTLNKYVADIAMSIGGKPVRFEPFTVGQNNACLEIPNDKVSMVGFKETLEKLPISNGFEDADLTIPFGKNIDGEIIYGNMKKFPHMYVCGTSGSGKSVFINSIIVNLLYRNSPRCLRILLVDPKRVEFSKYKDVPHLVCPPIKEAEEAIGAIRMLTTEMDNRYSILETTGCLDIKEYNEYAKRSNLPYMPYIVCIVDEYSDLVDVCREVEAPLIRLGQKARSSGIHLIIAMQRPDAVVLTSRLKANINTKVALMVGTSVDSKVALDATGAQDLLGNGDMLVSCPEVQRNKLTRLQAPYISSDEIRKFTDDLKSKYQPQYNEAFENISRSMYDISSNEGQYTQEYKFDDETFNAVREFTFSRETISGNALVMNFHIGNNTAKIYIDKLIEEGVIDSKSVGALGRKVLVHSIDELKDLKNGDL